MDNYEDEESFEESNEQKSWVAFWCNEGLERLVSVDEYKEKDRLRLADIIKNGSNNELSGETRLNHLLNALVMRARFNPQRHYELYVFNTVSTITEENLHSWFDDTPQCAVDWVRKNGKAILKKTNPSTKPVIE